VLYTIGGENMKINLRNLVSMLVLSLFTFGAYADSDVLETWTWAEPTTGTPVNHYVLYVSVDGNTYEPIAINIPTNIVSVYMPYGESLMKVAGVDSLGREGPWSVPSLVYELIEDLGPPGGCGVPVLVISE
jgi:hypothetical protein